MSHLTDICNAHFVYNVSHLTDICNAHLFYKHIHGHIHIHTFIHSFTHSLIHSFTHARMHACMHAFTYARTHTLITLSIHGNICVQVELFLVLHLSWTSTSNSALQQLLKDDTGRDANSSSSSMTFHSTTPVRFQK